MPKDAPLTALNWLATVVEPVTANEPVEVALLNSVLPASVVEAMIAERLALSCPPMLRTLPIVDDAVTAKAEVVAEVAERLSRVVKPVLETEKSVVVADAVDDAMANRVVFVSPLLAWMVNLLHGEVVPMPTLPPVVAKYAEPLEEITVVEA